ncbi:hypothetical protein HDK90DRAFT_477348 [Phyllosticta capitalensis]|uniref:Secreted protein n=1 Tax=Phyllosticta capitalensis TaxID=121624 RepID=A0ABR1Z1C7_9PEZI
MGGQGPKPARPASATSMLWSGPVWCLCFRSSSSMSIPSTPFGPLQVCPPEPPPPCAACVITKPLRSFCWRLLEFFGFGPPPSEGGGPTDGRRPSYLGHGACRVVPCCPPSFLVGFRRRCAAAARDGCFSGCDDGLVGLASSSSVMAPAGR